ncbi:MAG: M36 family metallopeptidase [Pyrinomonadaceae bacterium]
MLRISNFFGGFRSVLTLLVIALLTALVVIPGYLNIADASIEHPRTVNDEEVGFTKVYDIREDHKGDAPGKLELFRRSVGTNAAIVADVRDGFVRGEASLKKRLPSVKIEYNNDIRIPEVITPDVWRKKIDRLSAPSSQSRADILRNFAKENNELIGMNDGQINDLTVLADYENPAGNMGFAHLEQRINGVPVFRGEIKAGFTKSGEIVRVINNLAPGLDYGTVPYDFRDPSDAVRAAYQYINEKPGVEISDLNQKASNDLKTVFGKGDWATTAEKMYFPTEPGVAVPAWRVLIWQPVDAYYVIVDAETGTMLWRKNITDQQTLPATYQVYNNPNAYMPAADNPAPLSPGPVDPTTGTQGALISRTMVNLIGNEGPLSFNTNGWISDAGNSTDGNATEAGVDRVLPNGVDATQPGDGPCPGPGCRVFTSTWNPAPGNPAPGDDPLTPQAQRGAVIQMFYVMNRYHDVLYQLGFNEQSFNFQDNNFGRGGAQADRVSSEGQDNTVGSSCPAQPCTNNANFSTPADGGRGRMQMYVWDGPTPDYDGTADAEVIIHEATHGTSNRLHGNASGLSTNMAGGMGEGWSDFYSYSLLAEPNDPIDGIYTTGGYATFLAAPGFTSNYYYGIRRFPRAPITFLGANGRPHNPYTFRYINAGCAALLNGSTSAFPRGPFGVAQCDQVHNLGEIWSSMLWEVRNRMVARLTFTAGTQRALQVVTDGMKLAPLAPTILQERDAIIAAASALPFAPEAAADIIDVREGFRVRGAGFSASIQSISPAAVTEAFDFPNVRATDPFSVSDAPGDNDGFPEPAENVLLSVPVTNPNTGGAISNVQVNIDGGTNTSYGTINDGATVTMQIPYTVPPGAACGSMHQVMINVSSSIGAQAPSQRSFQLGAPVGGAPVTFTNNTLINLPAGQPGTTMGPASPYPSNIVVSGLTGNKLITVNLIGVTHTFPGDLDFLLVGPGGQKYIFLSDSGGGTDAVNLNMSFADSAAAQPPAAWVAGTFRPVNTGANDAFAAPAPAPPYTNAAPGGSDTLTSVFGTDGSTMNGTWSLYAVDAFNIDSGTISGGWSITFAANDFACDIANSNVSVSGRVVDGNGRGITNAYVTATAGMNTLVARSGTFGYFNLPALLSGTQYTIVPSKKRFAFTPQQITPAGNVTGIVFAGTPSP